MEGENFIDGVFGEFSSSRLLVDVCGLPDTDLGFVAELFSEVTADSVVW